MGLVPHPVFHPRAFQGWERCFDLRTQGHPSQKGVLLQTLCSGALPPQSPPPPPMTAWTGSYCFSLSLQPLGSLSAVPASGPAAALCSPVCPGGGASAADLLEQRHHGGQPLHVLELVSIRTVNASELSQQAQQLRIQKPLEEEVAQSPRGHQGKQRGIRQPRVPS